MALRAAPIMKIVNADVAFMSWRREKLLPGWWIMDIVVDEFFEGPFATSEAALRRFHRLRPHLQNAAPFDFEKKIPPIREC